MLLKSGTYWADNWNNTIIPAIKAGAIKQIRSTPKHFRRVYQLYYGILEENGIQFRITAWGFPNNEPHVHVECIGNTKKI